jgi:hypothetical protein
MIKNFNEILQEAYTDDLEDYKQKKARAQKVKSAAATSSPGRQAALEKATKELKALFAGIDGEEIDINYNRGPYDHGIRINDKKISPETVAYYRDQGNKYFKVADTIEKAIDLVNPYTRASNRVDATNYDGYDSPIKRADDERFGAYRNVVNSYNQENIKPGAEVLFDSASKGAIKAVVVEVNAAEGSAIIKTEAGRSMKADLAKLDLINKPDFDEE